MIGGTEIGDLGDGLSVIFDGEYNNISYSVLVDSDTLVFNANGTRMDWRKIQEGQYIKIKYNSTGSVPAISPRPVYNVVEITIE